MDPNAGMMTQRSQTDNRDPELSTSYPPCNDEAASAAPLSSPNHYHPAPLPWTVHCGDWFCVLFSFRTARMKFGSLSERMCWIFFLYKFGSWNIKYKDQRIKHSYSRSSSERCLREVFFTLQRASSIASRALPNSLRFRVLLRPPLRSYVFIIQWTAYKYRRSVNVETGTLRSLRMWTSFRRRTVG